MSTIHSRKVLYACSIIYLFNVGAHNVNYDRFSVLHMVISFCFICRKISVYLSWLGRGNLSCSWDISYVLVISLLPLLFTEGPSILLIEVL